MEIIRLLLFTELPRIFQSNNTWICWEWIW